MYRIYRGKEEEHIKHLMEVLKKHKELLDIKQRPFDRIVKEIGDKAVISEMKIDGILVVVEVNTGPRMGEGYSIAVTKGGVVREGLPVLDEVYNILESKGFKHAILHGELYGVDERGLPAPFTRVEGLLTNPSISEEDQRKIKLGVFDIEELDKRNVIEGTPDYKDRIPLIEELFKEGVLVHPIYYRIGDIETVKEMWNDLVLGKRLEGLVLYIDDVVKVKQSITYDCAVIGIEVSEKHPDWIGALILALKDPEGNYRYVGKVGTGFKLSERAEWLKWAKENRVEGPPRRNTIWVKPERVVEISTLDMTTHDKAPIYSFKKGKFEEAEKGPSAIGRLPTLVRVREDKSGYDVEDVGTDQIEHLFKKEIKKELAFIKAFEIVKRAFDIVRKKEVETKVICVDRAPQYKVAYAPSHPKNVVIPPNEFYPHGITEQDVYQYYQQKRIKQRLLEQFADNDVYLVLGVDSKRVIKRKEGTEYIKINSEEAYDKWNTGRVLSYHTSLPSVLDYVFVDIDPTPNISFDVVKEVTNDLKELFTKQPEVENVEVRFSGGRGFYVFSYLKQKRDIYELRAWLKGILEDYIETSKYKDILTLSPTKDKIRLDISTYHEEGGVRNAYTLNEKTGLVSVPVTDIFAFEKEDAKIENIKKSDLIVKVKSIEKVAGRYLPYREFTSIFGMLKPGDYIKPDLNVFRGRDFVGQVLFFDASSGEVEYIDILTGERGRIGLGKFFVEEREKEARASIVVESKLTEYRRKRKFDKTPEPVGEIGDAGGVYVVQLHRALKAGTHRDIRIEYNGVLKSFVAREELPSPGKNIYVTKVEDHPLSYKDFEGTIPKGLYGAGTVEKETEGKREILEWKPNKIKVRFIGGKFPGTYTLVKMGAGPVWKMFNTTGKSS